MPQDPHSFARAASRGPVCRALSRPLRHHRTREPVPPMPTSTVDPNARASSDVSRSGVDNALTVHTTRGMGCSPLRGAGRPDPHRRGDAIPPAPSRPRLLEPEELPADLAAGVHLGVDV